MCDEFPSLFSCSDIHVMDFDDDSNYHSMNHMCIHIRECFNHSSMGKHPRSMVNTILLFIYYLL